MATEEMNSTDTIELRGEIPERRDQVQYAHPLRVNPHPYHFAYGRLLPATLATHGWISVAFGQNGNKTLPNDIST